MPNEPAEEKRTDPGPRQTAQGGPLRGPARTRLRHRRGRGPAKATAFVETAARTWGIVLQPGDVSLATNAGCGTATGFLRAGLTHSFVSLLPGLSGTAMAAETCYQSQF